MASIRMRYKKLITIGDEMEEVEVDELVPFEPPICNVCNQQMRNVNTVNGVRRYQCVTWGCTNRKMVTL
jgi:hypothetical protein